jgi:hypothetical protein
MDSLLSRTSIFEKMQNSMAEVTGIDPEEVTLHTDLEEYESTDVLRMLARLGADPALKLHFNLKDRHFLADVSACETFADVLDLVEDTYRYDRLEDDDDLA